MRIAIEPSSFSKNQIKYLIEETNPLTTFVFRIKKVGEWKNYDFSEYNKRVLTYDDEINLRNVKYEYEPSLIQLIHEVINDHQTLLFYDREGFIKNYGFGLSNFTRYISNLVVEYFFFYKEVNPDLKYFRSTPHNLESWVNAIVAENLGITVLVGHATTLFRRSLKKGFRKEREFCKVPFELANRNISNEISILNSLYIKTQSKYKDAMPEYERKRFAKNKGKHYKLSVDLIKWWKKPHLVYNKYVCYNEYETLSEELLKNEKYIIFFMHYQPERTSHPEGFGFAQQMIIIHTLRLSAPKNVTIVVKEHPSVFTNKCDLFHRHPSFYRDIESLQGVKLLKLETDNFDIIDNALAVATITGTVGREALIRGVPTVYFGINDFTNVLGVESFKTVEHLKFFIDQCLLGFDKKKVSESIYQGMLESLQFSITGRSKYPSEGNYVFEEFVKAELELLKELCNNNVIIP